MHTTDVNLTERRRDTKSQEQEERSATWRHPWGPHLLIAEAVQQGHSVYFAILKHRQSAPGRDTSWHREVFDGWKLEDGGL